MTKTLERDLSLFSTTTISIGAMIGSGIFVLPGLAFKIAGPAVIGAYLLAGVIVIPAVLSKAEMATAMPEAGGTYLYIDRAMGPLLGTIAGVGAWFSLTFKSAFALVGLGAYLVLFSAFPPKAAALIIAILLLLVNVIGVKQTGRLQSIIVAVVVAALVFFVADGLTFVDSAQYDPFLSKGREGFLAATGFVFVSYAGVTKIASVAEEVENPGRNIPIAMLASVLLMMVVYALVVFVVVGVTEPNQLAGSVRPMAVAAEQFSGVGGSLTIAVVAVIALTSMANAGVLSASRFPFAMSRDELAPKRLGYVHQEFNTPIVAILLTGAVLLVLIRLVPVLELAKLASAFKILVFSLVNVALIAFRESGLEWYDPDFIAPAYPWVQLFGLVAGFLLLTQMGALPIGGAVAIILVGIIWYLIYGRERTEREGAALDAIRRGIGAETILETEQIVEAGRDQPVVVVLGPNTSRDRERTLLLLATHIASFHSSRVEVVLFEEVPEQMSLSSAAASKTDLDRQFEQQSAELAGELSAPTEFNEIVSHDARKAVRNHVADVDASLTVGEVSTGRFRDELLGHDIDWFMNHLPGDVAFVRDRGLDDLSEIAVLAQRGPHGPLKVAIANAIATECGARIRFVTGVDVDASDEEVARAEAFHVTLDELVSAETTSTITRTDDILDGLVEASAGADVAIVGHDPHTIVHDILLGDLSNDIAGALDCTVLLVHSRRSGSFIRRIVKRAVF